MVLPHSLNDIASSRQAYSSWVELHAIGVDVCHGWRLPIRKHLNNGVERSLPETEDSEELSDEVPEAHDPASDEPVEKVCEPVATSHCYLLY